MLVGYTSTWYHRFRATGACNLLSHCVLGQHPAYTTPDPLNKSLCGKHHACIHLQMAKIPKQRTKPAKNPPQQSPPANGTQDIAAKHHRFWRLNCKKILWLTVHGLFSEMWGTLVVLVHSSICPCRESHVSKTSGHSEEVHTLRARCIALLQLAVNSMMQLSMDRHLWQGHSSNNQYGSWDKEHILRSMSLASNQFAVRPMMWLCRHAYL